MWITRLPQKTNSKHSIKIKHLVMALFLGHFRNVAIVVVVQIIQIRKTSVKSTLELFINMRSFLFYYKEK